MLVVLVGLFVVDVVVYEELCWDDVEFFVYVFVYVLYWCIVIGVWVGGVGWFVVVFYVL